MVVVFFVIKLGHFTNWPVLSLREKLEAKKIISVQLIMYAGLWQRYPSNMGPIPIAVVKTPFQVDGSYGKAFSSLSYYHCIKPYSLTTT